tara:strand:+ start:213 stop:431 length:219 start_codon:yes stop_codon:yes gene_type:complete
MQHRFPEKRQRQIALRLRLRQAFSLLDWSELDVIARRLALKTLKPLITFSQKSHFLIARRKAKSYLQTYSKP